MSARAYYNEIDPKAAAWLRELIKRGLIPAGEVDERSIVDVRGSDLAEYNQCHFFAGIGGWSYALQLAGWPADEPVWTGSCPCQPFSCAGKGKGTADERHLWPEFARLISECRPAKVFGEQVASKAGREWLAGVFADLEGMGYAAAGADLCAAGVGAPHIRQRLFWVADDEHDGSHRALRLAPESHSNGQDRRVSERGDGTSRLQHAASDGREQRRPESGGRGAECGCGDGDSGLPHAGSERRAELGQGRDEPTGSSETGGVGGWVGDTGESRLERHTRHGDDGSEPGRIDAQPHGSIAPPGFWSDFDILPFRDGKARRVESGTFPLAHGVSNRVVKLRGFGNAIVPQVAAEFIKAYIEASLAA